jgi:heptosyltransferase-2
VLRFLALGLEPGEPLPVDAAVRWPPALEVDQSNRQRLMAELDLPQSRTRVALMPGAEYGPAKRWPAARYGELAAAFAARGAAVLILGSAREREIGEEIRSAAAADVVRNLCGRTSLADVVDLLSAVDVAVTNDSGLMHVAAAAGAYVVAIYGSSSPSLTPPLTTARQILYLGLDCSPCFARTCPLTHLRCLREIAVSDVLTAAGIALAGRPSADG